LAINDDWSMRKILGMPLLGLNSLSFSPLMLTQLLNYYAQVYNYNNFDRVITFSNCDSLATTFGTDSWITNYLSSFTDTPTFNSVNLLDGTVTPQSITINGNEYYGSGYLLRRLADFTKGVHFESHITDWTTISQLLSPSLRPTIDSIKLTTSFVDPQDSIKEFTEVNPNRSDPERPLFYLGATNSLNQVNFDANVWFSGISEVKHKTVSYQFSIDTLNTLKIIPSMLGFEKLKDLIKYNSHDTSGIVRLALKYHLLCDYTALLCLEANDTLHFIDPDGGPTPIKTENFTISQNNNSVIINWITTLETNNLGFEIERKFSNNSFMKIGFVKGKGTSSERWSYSFIDNRIPSGIYTYRINQVDMNGTVHCLKEFNIEVGKILQYSLDQNYPNPFNPSTTIKYQIPKTGFVNLKVFDLLGRVVATLVNEEKPAGKYSVDFNASKFSSGVYIYELKTKDFTSCKKMMLTK
jgi:hypothetical protein